MNGIEQHTPVRSRTTSFIVRIWSSDESGEQIRGEVEHIGTGERRLFGDYWSLRSYLESWRRADD